MSVLIFKIHFAKFYTGSDNLSIDSSKKYMSKGNIRTTWNDLQKDSSFTTST